MRRGTALLVLAVLAIASLSIAGCGGGDDDGGGGSSPESTESAATESQQSGGASEGDDASEDDVSEDGSASEGPVSKAAFVKQADAVCDSVKRDVRQDFKLSKGNFLPTLAAALQEEVSQVEALPLPAGEEEVIEVMLDTAQRAIADFEARADGDNASGDNNRALLEAEKLADAYGLKACWIAAG